MSTRGHGEPPEGVLAGEDVPTENDCFAIEQSKIDAIVTELRTREPWATMPEDVVRDRVITKIESKDA